MFICFSLIGSMFLFFYAFNFLVLGIYCSLFFINLLIMGWAMGFFTCAIILRWGQSAESLAWMMPFFVQPLSAVFYPVSILPTWLQPIALCFPSTHVFEGMREIINTGINAKFTFALCISFKYCLSSRFFYYLLLSFTRSPQTWLHSQIYYLNQA